jgi:hypothetical protein
MLTIVLLTDHTQVRYCRSYRNQFSATFDAYLAILRHVQQDLDQAIRRDAQEWRLRYGCPACGYKVLQVPTPFTSSLIINDSLIMSQRSTLTVCMRLMGIFPSVVRVQQVKVTQGGL